MPMEKTRRRWYPCLRRTHTAQYHGFFPQDSEKARLRAAGKIQLAPTDIYMASDPLRRRRHRLDGVARAARKAPCLRRQRGAFTVEFRHLHRRAIGAGHIRAALDQAKALLLPLRH